MKQMTLGRSSEVRQCFEAQCTLDFGAVRTNPQIRSFGDAALIAASKHCPEQFAWLDEHR